MKKGTRFLKRIVGFCIGFIVAFTVVSMYLNYRVGIELSPTLTTCVYAFFGTELASTALIRIFDKSDTIDVQNSDPRQEATQKTFYTDK